MLVRVARFQPQVQLVDASAPGEVRLDSRLHVVDAPTVLTVYLEIAFVTRRADRFQRPRDLRNLVDDLSGTTLVRHDAQRLLSQVGYALPAGRNISLSP